MEQVEDVLDRYRQFREFSNAREASRRRLRTEDHLEGKAYLEWDIPLTAFDLPLGRAGEGVPTAVLINDMFTELRLWGLWPRGGDGSIRW